MLVVVGGLAAMLILGSYPRNGPPTPPPPAPKVSPELEARVRLQLALAEITNNVSLTKTIWRKDGTVIDVSLKFSAIFGTVMVATFAFHNGNKIAVKDIEVKCDQYGPSGTLISTTADTIYHRLPPKADTTVEGFNLGFIHVQSATARCMVTKAAPSV